MTLWDGMGWESGGMDQMLLFAKFFLDKVYFRSVLEEYNFMNKECSFLINCEGLGARMN